MPEKPSPHEGEIKKRLLIEDEAGATIEQMSAETLVSFAFKLKDQMYREMQNAVLGAGDGERFDRILDSIDATRAELLRRFSSMQEKIAVLESEIATLKGNK